MSTPSQQTTTESPAGPRPERVAHALVRDVPLVAAHGTGPTLGTLALVTVDNGLDHTKPTTLGIAGLTELRTVLLAQQARAAAGEIAAVAVTGKPYYLAAGADLSLVQSITRDDEARQVAELGHAAYRLLGEMGVPTFAFINGAALGGGLELALSCDYRTVAGDVRALALPETYLGLVPGWGGCHLLPRLVGVSGALDVILTKPLANNRMTDAGGALATGLVDVVLHPADFLEQSVAWATEVLQGDVTVERRPLDSPETWAAVCAGARDQLDARLHGTRPAPYRALELITAGRDRSRDEAFAAEDDALTELIMSEELRAGLYAFDLVNRVSRRPAGAPDPALARPVRSVGIVGAGLMAAQLALLLARKLGVPVVMRDLDDARVTAGLASVQGAVEKMVARGRLTADASNRLLGQITGTTELADLAGADLVIEAVTEVLGLKKRVFAELEGVVSPEAVLATNTSALSVSAMAEGLQHPERVVGLHFFNPVAQMPLVEVVRTEASSDEAVATAFAVAKNLGKTAVGVADRPGFVVNRLLLRMLAEVTAAVEAGTPVGTADVALRPLGLPMGPFALMQLVGLPVALHVLESLHADLGDRFPLSPGLGRLTTEQRRVVLDSRSGQPDVDPSIQDAFEGGATVAAPLDAAGVLDAVVAGLAQEVGLMLDEGVVSGPEQIDLCMILGAGWPLHLGGITPYLDRTGYAERVIGRRLLPDGVANVRR